MYSQKAGSFKIPLKNPLNIQGTTVYSRTGFHLQIAEGLHLGVGECSPLPGLHKETAEDCYSQWEKLKPDLLKSPKSFEKFSLNQPGFGVIPLLESIHPALEFAIEQALLHLYLQQSESHLEKLFNVTGEVISVPVNSLLIPTEQLLAHPKKIASQILKTQHSAVKIKIGRFSLEKELSFVKKLLRLLEGRCKVRLDGNGLLSPTHFQQFSAAFQKEPAHLSIEYIEEPLSFSSTRISRLLYEKSTLPIMLEESLPLYLRELELGRAFPSGVCGFVIKPSVFGGIHKTVRLLEFAKAHLLQPVLSSAFDPPWSLATHALLCQLSPFGDPPLAMGLDTLEYFENSAIDALTRKDYTTHQGVFSVRTHLFKAI